MLTTILSLAIPVILKLVEHFLDKSKAERETIEAFYNFIEKLDKDSTNSVKLKISYDEQLKKLKARKKAEN